MREGDAPALAVVATAGHVDHGKSSLVLRLTGTDPDRLAEEKRRGLTIELGYAWCTLPSGIEVAFVDVPGHERFVRTMLAGVGPVRLVLFVVAADEGWEPQSEEHLEIVDVLGVDGAVIAITKCDLVTEEDLGAVTDELRERVAGTALAGAPIIACSSTTGEGIDALISALDSMLMAAPRPEHDGRPRWFVDRVFTMRGAGTVATGTLRGGPIDVGDEVEIHPSGQRAKVRGLQVHGREVDVAHPICRVAANLAGEGRDRIQRGDVVTRPGDWRPTRVIEARLTPVRSRARSMTARGAFTMHAGSAERTARVRLYDTPVLPPEGAFARIRVSAPLVLDVGDRFVIRESGRRETVAGGVVLDVDPPARPGVGAGRRLSARLAASRDKIPGLLVAERGAANQRDLLALTGRAPAALAGAARLGDWWIADTARAAVEEHLLGRLERFHRSDPLAAGEDIAAVRSAVLEVLRSIRVPADADLATALTDDLTARGVLVRDGSIVRLATHAAALPPQAEARLVEAVRDGEPTPPSVNELISLGFPRGEIDAAVRAGALVRVAPDLVLTPSFVARAIEAIEDAGGAGITVSALRERLGTSRRFAVPLAEHLDRTGVTRRSGDLRFPRAR